MVAGRACLFTSQAVRQFIDYPTYSLLSIQSTWHVCGWAQGGLYVRRRSISGVAGRGTDIAIRSAELARERNDEFSTIDALYRALIDLLTS